MNREWFLKKINEFILLVEDLGGSVNYCDVDDVASLEEIEALEDKIGEKVPDTMKYILMNISKKVSFNGYLPDNWTFKGKFRDIGGFGLEWDIEEIHIDYIDDFDFLKEDIETFKEDFFDLGEVKYFTNVSFANNGDVLVIPNTTDSLIYWSHDGEGLIYLATNFEDFLFRIFDLFIFGPEFWGYEAFLTKEGIDSKSEVAVEFKNIFAYLSDKTKNKQVSSIEDAFKYIGYLKELDDWLINQLKEFDNKTLYLKTIEDLKKKSPFRERDVYYFVLTNIVKDEAKEWILSEFHSSESDIPFRDKAYLISSVLNPKEAFSLIESFLMGNTSDKGKINTADIYYGFKYIEDNSINCEIYAFIENKKLEEDSMRYICDLINLKKMNLSKVKEWIHKDSRLREYISRTFIKYGFGFINDCKVNEDNFKNELIFEIEFIISNEVLERSKEDLKKLRKQIDN